MSLPTLTRGCLMCRRPETAVEVELPHAPGIPGQPTQEVATRICRECTRACVKAWATCGASAWAGLKRQWDNLEPGQKRQAAAFILGLPGAE